MCVVFCVCVLCFVLCVGVRTWFHFVFCVLCVEQFFCVYNGVENSFCEMGVFVCGFNKIARHTFFFARVEKNKQTKIRTNKKKNKEKQKQTNKDKNKRKEKQRKTKTNKRKKRTNERKKREGKEQEEKEREKKR